MRERGLFDDDDDDDDDNDGTSCLTGWNGWNE